MKHLASFCSSISSLVAVTAIIGTTLASPTSPLRPHEPTTNLTSPTTHLSPRVPPKPASAPPGSWGVWLCTAPAFDNTNSGCEWVDWSVIAAAGSFCPDLPLPLGTSFGPDDGVTCYVYEQYHCAGRYMGPITHPGTNDLVGSATPASFKACGLEVPEGLRWRSYRCQWTGQRLVQKGCPKKMLEGLMGA